eukprot:m.421031 g.421031  ORF g.421031 m.421031 type:complete len:716 (-) comp20192_c0_seq14:2563-4710(-)
MSLQQWLQTGSLGATTLKPASKLSSVRARATNPPARHQKRTLPAAAAVTNKKRARAAPSEASKPASKKASRPRRPTSTAVSQQQSPGRPSEACRDAVVVQSAGGMIGAVDESCAAIKAQVACQHREDAGLLLDEDTEAMVEEDTRHHVAGPAGKIQAEHKSLQDRAGGASQADATDLADAAEAARAAEAASRGSAADAAGKPEEAGGSDAASSPPPGCHAEHPTEAQRQPGSDVSGDSDGSDGSDDDAGEYERQRLANIQSNAALLQQLGLLDSAPRLEPAPTQKAKVPKKKRPSTSRRQQAAALAEHLPRRKSARLKGKTAMDPMLVASATAEAMEREPTPEPAYLPQIGQAFPSVATGPNKASAVAFASTQHLLDSGKAKLLTGHRHNVYSMDMFRLGATSLLAAAGKGGVVSFFDCAQSSDDGIAPLLSAKVHKRWIAQIQTITFNDEQRLLSCADDGLVILSELRKDASGLAQLRPLSSTHNLHRTGIFSLHAQDNKAVTCGKDGCVGLLTLAEAGLAGEESHETSDQVLKSVRWQPNSTSFACCGNDRSIRLFDSRQPQQQTSVVEDAHDGAVNSLKFSTAEQRPFELFSSGFDKTIRVWDVRSLRCAKMVFRGHHAPGRDRPSLTSPIYYGTHHAIVTIGDNTPFLHQYNIESDTCKGRQQMYVGFTPSCLFATRTEGVEGLPALSAASGTNAIWHLPGGFKLDGPSMA